MTPMDDARMRCCPGVDGQAGAISANAAGIAYVSKTVWQENTSDQYVRWDRIRMERRQ